MRAASIALLLVAGCGRFGFTAVDDTHADASGDLAGDVTGDGPRPACSGSDIVCELFDAPLSGWVMFDTNTALDPGVAHRGASALHVHSDAVAANGNGYFGIAKLNVVPAGVSPLYLRVWARLGSLPVNNMELFSFQQTPGNEDGVFVVSPASAYSVYSQFEERSRDTGAVPALDTWTCLLFTVVRGASGSLRLEGDVGPVQMNNVITDGNPLLKELDVGIGFSATTTDTDQPPVDVWFDDLIVRDAPITCAE